MKRLDVLLEQYERERLEAKTWEQLRQANQKLVQGIDALPGEKTPIESIVRSLFARMLHKLV